MTEQYHLYVDSNNQSNTNLRFYIVNLNFSESISLYGYVPLKISSISTTLETTEYVLSYEPNSLLITSTLSDEDSQISLPIPSSEPGSTIRVEVAICNIKIERVNN